MAVLGELSVRYLLAQLLPLRVLYCLTASASARCRDCVLRDADAFEVLQPLLLLYRPLWG